MPYQPPFTITPQIINPIAAIAHQLGCLDSQTFNPSPQLHKQNRICTIHTM
ncbi:MAG: hypothetical protein AAGG51_00275 [Cyanobacteria bacterium P01_G01_bin.54]